MIMFEKYNLNKMFNFWEHRSNHAIMAVVDEVKFKLYQFQVLAVEQWLSYLFYRLLLLQKFWFRVSSFLD